MVKNILLVDNCDKNTKRNFHSKHRFYSKAFTIIELLVVIVVIGILASITIVSYSGITQRAMIASLQSDLANASKQIEMDKVLTDGYPATQAVANSGLGLKKSPNTTLQYTSTLGTYCLAAKSTTNSNLMYYISSDTGSVQPGSCGDWKQIAAGDSHACAITLDDTGYCWGWNGDGQLGNGLSEYDRTSPVKVLNGAMPTDKVKAMAAGYSHTCAINFDNNTYCWGYNGSGELGNGTYDSSLLPVLVPNGAMPAGAIKAITAGFSHTCAIASDDRPYCWGYNSSGQLGDNSITTRTLPVQVISGALPSGAVKAIAAGNAHTCVIASDDRLYCWGENGGYQLGDGSTTDRRTPIKVSDGTLPAGIIKSISAGDSHTCAIASNDGVYCWGSNGSGRLGDGTTIAKTTPITTLLGAMPVGPTRYLAIGEAHSCVIASDNKPYCWGINSAHELGDGTAIAKSAAVSVLVGAIPNGTIKSLVTGQSFNCVIASDGKAYCWGRNNYGQIGNGTETSFVGAPVQVSSPL